MHRERVTSQEVSWSSARAGPGQGRIGCTPATQVEASVGSGSSLANSSIPVERLACGISAIGISSIQIDRIHTRIEYEPACPLGVAISLLCTTHQWLTCIIVCARAESVPARVAQLCTRTRPLQFQRCSQSWHVIRCRSCPLALHLVCPRMHTLYLQRRPNFDTHSVTLSDRWCTP